MFKLENPVRNDEKGEKYAMIWILKWCTSSANAGTLSSVLSCPRVRTNI